MKQSICVVIILISWCIPAYGEPTLVLNTFSVYPRSAPDGRGSLDRIIREACRRTGYNARIVPVSSERGLINADRGVDDGDFVRISGLENIYPNLIMVPEKLTEFEFAVFTKDPSVKITGWESLKPFHVGIINGWKLLETGITSYRSMTKVKDEEALFKLLVHDRVDVVVYDRLQGDAFIKGKGYEGVKAVRPALARRDMFLYLNRRHAGIVPALASAIREMKRDGTFRRMTEPMPGAKP